MKYFSCVETAKLIRKSLKEAFPRQKFSVRSSTYSGGASIRISWVDGPNDKQVRAVVNRYEGSYFDGMIDYKGSIKAEYDGEEVHFGADFIFTEREYSDVAVERAIEAIKRRYKNNVAEYVSELTVENYRYNRLWNMQMCGGVGIRDSVQGYIGEELSRFSYVLKVSRSKEAEKVGGWVSDGYGNTIPDAEGNTGMGYPSC